MPAAEMFGTAALLRKIAGVGQKGDTLSALTVPLNFAGMAGAGRFGAGQMFKSLMAPATKAAYKPINTVNQYKNYFKAKKLVKQGQYHGSAEISKFEPPLSGESVLDGTYGNDPHYGMGFFSTSSKSEADLYAGGYNVPGSWGESGGSMNQVTKIPFGKYIDFRNKNLKSQNYKLWELLQGKSFGYAGEELGSFMNQAGTTGSIMPRISAGQAPGDINSAIWLALNKPKGTTLQELGFGFPPKLSMGGYIPKFKDGINNVPSNMLAQLHKNEAVIPAKMNPFNPNARKYAMGGPVYDIPAYSMGGRVKYNAGGMATSSNALYNINVTLNGTDMNPNDVAKAIDQQMRMREAMNGRGRNI